MTVFDRNGVLLSLGMRVEKQGRVGKVIGTLGSHRVFVRWEGEQDDELESADTLATVDAVRHTRRRGWS